MAYILKNENVEIHIDDPMVNYKFSRFDWTGKIVKVQYKGISFASRERKDEVNEDQFGKGFYNEFGIDSPLGFKDIKVGEWFHKIGIGLLQKTSDHYDFMNKYLIRPAKFVVEKKNESVTIKCISSLENGYAYNLSKDICLNSDGFEIHYQLRNTGAKQINTDEYVHNFISIGNKSIGEDYLLKFPSTLCPGLNGEVVNPEGRVLIQNDEISFSGTPNEQFFYSHLVGTDLSEASWKLVNLRKSLGISEKGSFKTKKINLWGWNHVISPELFCDISILPDETIEWSRAYKLFSFH